MVGTSNQSVPEMASEFRFQNSLKRSLTKELGSPRSPGALHPHATHRRCALRAARSVGGTKGGAKSGADATSERHGKRSKPLGEPLGKSMG